MESDRTIELPQGTIRYRDAGTGEPIVFVHGLLVDGSLWRNVTPRLREDFRCIVPDLPLGSHTIALKPSADRSPRGVAHLIADFLEGLDLRNVTLVANDTGGAITQLLVTERPERVGRLVLTNCDCYENFLPPAFRPLQWAAHVPGLLALVLQALRSSWFRRLPLAYGLLTKRPIPDAVTGAWVRPFLNDRGVRHDATRFLAKIDSRDTLAAAQKLRGFDRPALLVWAREDPFFKLRFAERLARDIPRARLESIGDSRAFVPEDQPERLAELIAEFAKQPLDYDGAGAGSQSGGNAPASTSPAIGGK
jgi:pimeloyl-ACP methyl ester carboxylesterase